MVFDMTRHQGDVNLPLIECTDTKLQKYHVRADMQPYFDEETKEQRGITFIETEFPYKPSMKEVKEFVLGVINAQTDDKILTGYQWKVLHGKDKDKVASVWLSEENQNNYKAYHDAAVIYPDVAVFPVVYKIGEDANGEAIYEDFQSVQELAQFYLGGISHIKQCLDEGFAKKDSFDFTPYEEALNPTE